MIARDCKCIVVMSVCTRINPSSGAEEAEAEAVLMRLAELSTVYRGHVVVESDCLNLINRLKKNLTERSHLFHIINYIKAQTGIFQYVTWSAVRRIQNKMPHELAGLARRKGECRILAGVPDELTDLSLSDCKPPVSSV